MKKFVFKLEHLAFQPAPGFRRAAFELLCDLGLDEWAHDVMTTRADDFDVARTKLEFNYQSMPTRTYPGTNDVRPIEVEIMQGVSGRNWLDGVSQSVISHFGMHVTWEQMRQVKLIFENHGIDVAQQSFTIHHQNPHVNESRRYFKRIYDTRQIIGVDLEFNVHINITDVPADGLFYPRDVPLECRV